MTGYTPTPTKCHYCGTAVFPNTPNEITVKRDGEWVSAHSVCPSE